MVWPEASGGFWRRFPVAGALGWKSSRCLCEIGWTAAGWGGGSLCKDLMGEESVGHLRGLGRSPQCLEPGLILGDVEI